MAFIPRDKRTVTAKLPDGTISQRTSVGRLRRAFRRQSEIWKENFFYNLLNNGSIEQSGVIYTLDSFNYPQKNNDGTYSS